MKTTKLFIFLCAGLFSFACITSNASALPFTLTDIDLGKKSEYIDIGNFKIEFEANTAGVDGLSWSFEVKKKEGELDDNKFSFKYGNDDGKGSFSFFEVTPENAGEGLFTFKGQMIFKDYGFSWLDGEEEIYLVGSFTANSPLGSFVADVTGDQIPIPEPATMLLLGVGLLGLAGISRRRIRK